ncbi:MAG: hypothetical protein AAF465_11310 [Pseudomonadota bacterium]
MINPLLRALCVRLMRWTTLAATGCLLLTPAMAQDAAESETAEEIRPLSANNTSEARSSIQLKTTSVTGSRELPKVLVIVPWKTSEAIGPGERPLSSLVEDALTPVDPDVFRRQLDYYTDLKEAAAESRGDAQ